MPFDLTLNYFNHYLIVELHFVPDHDPKLMENVVFIPSTELIEILTYLVDDLYFIGLG